MTDITDPRLAGLPEVYIEGVKVLDLSSLDKLHGFNSGWFRGRFQTARKGLVEGVDYFKRTAMDIRAMYPGVYQPHTTANMTFLTRSGYCACTSRLKDRVSKELREVLLTEVFKESAPTAGAQTLFDDVMTPTKLITEDITEPENTGVLSIVRRYYSPCILPVAESPTLERAYLSIMDKLDALTQRIDKLERAPVAPQPQPPATAPEPIEVEPNALLTMEQAAKLLGIGRTRLFDFVRAKGMFINHSNLPYQKFIDRGYFKVKTSNFVDTYGREKTSMKALVTQRGLLFIQSLLNNQ